MLKKIKIPLTITLIMTILFVARDNFSFSKQLQRYYIDSCAKAEYVLLYNNSNNSIMFSKKPDEVINIGSITKIMTALVALQYLQHDQEITIGEEVDSCLTADASRSMIKCGQKFTFKQLLYAMLVPSGCDAAYSIAVNTSRYILNDYSISTNEAVDIFCDLMNKKAMELGCKNTFFMNPDGQDEFGQCTTLSDVLKIVVEALKYDIFKETVNTASITITPIKGEEYTWENTNFLIRKDSRYYNKNICGVKTGYTLNAGYSLVSTAKINDTELICLVANCSYEGLRYTISEKLFAGGFAELNIIWKK